MDHDTDKGLSPLAQLAVVFLLVLPVAYLVTLQVISSAAEKQAKDDAVNTVVKVEDTEGDGLSWAAARQEHMANNELCYDGVVYFYSSKNPIPKIKANGLPATVTSAGLDCTDEKGDQL